MAEANARINVDINTNAAATGLRQLQSQITAFNSTLTKSSAVQATALRNSTQNLLELVNASRFFTAETVRMQTAAASLDKTLSKGQVTIGQFFGARFRKDSLAAAQVMSLANARASALQTQFIATGAAANGLRDAIAIRPLQAFNDAAVVSAQKLAIHRAMLNQATTQMINFGKNTQWAGRQLMVGFTVPLTIFAGVAGKTFRELEREAVNFRKVYGDAFTPPEEMEQNLQAVQELAKEYTKYGIAVKDTIALAAEAAAAGAQNKDLLDATAQATRLATLGQMQQNEALETTISLQNAFKLSGDELAKSINFLNMVENQTVVTLQDLSAAIPRVAPVIKGLGGDVEDLAAFMAALQEGGVTAEQGANALKSGLASLINPTDRAKEKLDSLGISLDSIIQMNRGDLMGVVQDFATALDTLDEFTRQQALEQVFGKFQYARLGALFANINKDGTQAARVLEMTGMSAAEMAASAEKELGAIEEAVGTKFTAAMEQLKLAIAPIGELFTKMAIPVINFFTSVLDRFNNLPDFAKTFSAFAAVIIGIVIPTGTMFLGLLMNLVGTLIKFGSIVGSAFKGFTSGGFKGAFDAVSQSLKYMSLSEMDAVNSAQQLAGSTEAVNIAFRDQVGASESAQAAVMELAYAYEILTQQMREAAIQNEMVFGVGAAAMGAAGARGPRVRRNRGGTIPGSGNTDTVPAMLTPGEFVVNKQATQQNLGLLRQINAGGKVPGFTGGGLAAMKAIAKGLPSLTRKQVVEDYGVPLSTLKKHSLNLGIPKDSRGQYIYNVETIPLILRQIKNPYQKTHTSPFRSMTTFSSQIPGTSNRAQVAKMLADAGIPIELLDDAWLKLPFNQALRGNGISGKDLIKELKAAIKDQGSSFWGPAWSNVNKKEFIKNLEENIVPSAIYTDYGARGGQNFGSALWKSAAQSGGLNKKAVGAYIPKVQELKNSIDTLNNFYPDKIFRVERGADGYQYLEVVDKITGKQLYREMARGSYGFNKGNIVPGQGNKDTVPAMLTPGEFVVNKKATQSNIELLRAINDGTVRGYAAGDIVGDKRNGFYAEGTNGLRSGPFPTRRMARKEAKQIIDSLGISKSRGGFMGGARGMGMGMGMGMLGGAMFMGAGMMPNQTAATAMNVGGIGLSAASMLPMIPGAMGALASPPGLIIAGIAAAAAAAAGGLYMLRKSLDESARKTAEFAANLGGTANALNTIAEISGQQTPLQRKKQMELGITNADIENIMSPQMSAMLSSEKGQKLIQELDAVTSAERFQKLADYLKYAIASGLMDQEMAQSFAKAVSMELNDSLLSSKVVKTLAGQETGSRALVDLASQRASAAGPVLERLQRELATGFANQARGLTRTPRISENIASQSIGVSIQALQDYSNAQALAQEELANGTITAKEFAEINAEITEQQAKFGAAISNSIQNVDDIGAAMQATKDQLINAGIVTEEQFKSMEQAASVAAETLGVTAAAELTEGFKGAGVAALAMGTDITLVNAGLRDLAAAANGASNAMSISFEALKNMGLSEGQALTGAIAETQIMGLFGGMAPGREAVITDQLREFITASGSDVAGLQSMLATMTPQEAASTMSIFGGFEDVATQNKFISDFQNLTSTVGTEFARQITMGEEYLSQLEKGQTTLIDTINESASIFGEKTQEIYQYAKDTGKPFEQLAEYGKDIAQLSQEAVFRLGIDVTNIDDLEKFGPIAESINQNWPILENLNKDINMSAYIDFVTVDENGDKLNAKETYENVKELNKAWKAANNLDDIEARKNAIFELRTLQNGVQMPLESFNSIWNDLIEEYGQKIIQKLPTSVLTKVISLELQLAASESSVAAAKQALATGSLQGSDRAFANAIVAREGKRASEIRAEMESSIYGSAFGPGPETGPGGGGGGTPEKTIPEILREEAKLATGFAKTFSGKRGANFLAKPFGPEFLEYLRSQGQKGLDLLKGNLKALQGAYKDFQKTQKAESLMVLQFMPGQLQDQLKAQKAELYLTTAISKQYGVSSEIASKILSTLDDTQKVELERLMISGKVTKEYKNIINEAIDLYKWNKENAKLLEYMAMSEEDRQEAIISNQMTINDLQRQLEELKSGGIRDLEDQVEAQQRIIDGISRTIELKQRESDAINRAIELKQRELEPIDKQIDAYEEQIDQITEYYDKQLEALDEVQKRESELEQLRRGQLDVASALSRGDVAAAASAAIELRRQFSEQRREDVRSALEKRRQSEIEDIQEKINQQQEKRKAIEEEINQLQLKQRGIQDEIYALQQSQIPIQDRIYDLQQDIQKEADRLDSAYDNATSSVRALELQLRAAEQAAKDLAAASGGSAGGGGGAGGGGDSGGGGGGGGTIGNNPFPDGPDATSKAQHRIWLADSNFNIGNYPASRNYLGAAAPYINQISNVNARNAVQGAWNSTDQRLKSVGYMYGGKVNYQGSREPAPGFMMGGKVNKYAFGSFVPGTGMTDKVPAMLTPGEFVVRKSVAQKFGPMLEKMNSQVFPGVGKVNASPNIGNRFSNVSTDFAKPLAKVSSIGNKIMPSPNMRMSAPGSKSFSVPRSQPISSATSMAAAPRSSGGSSGNISYNNPVEYNYSITVNAQSVSSADDIASTVISKIKRIDDRNIKGVSL